MSARVCDTLAILLLPCVFGCGAASRDPGPTAPRAPASLSCDRARVASHVASGDLDGVLEASEGCTADPEIARQRQQALMELGEVEPAPAAGDALREARASIELAAKVAASDSAAAARARARARHLFERATGVASRRVAISDPTPLGFSGQSSLWHVKLRGAAAGHRFLLVTEGGGASPLRPTNAIDLGLADAVTIVPAGGKSGGALASTPNANTIWRAPWLTPVTLPAGRATLDANGEKVAIVRGDDLDFFDTVKGTRIASVPKIKASGGGVFATPALYAEVGNGPRALVVDAAKGTVVVDEPDVLACAVSPTGKLVALLLLGPARKPSTMPRVSLVWVDAAAPSKPRITIDLAEAMGGIPFLAFDGDRGVAVLVGQISAMGQEGSTALLAYVPSGSKTIGRAPKDFEIPDRSVAFERVAKLAAPKLAAPRVAVDQWLHSQTFAEDRESGRAAIVTGLPMAEAQPSQASKPSIMFIDTNSKQLVRDVRLPVEDLIVEGLSLAPGGRSAMISARVGPSFLVDGDTGDVLPGSFSPEGAIWSADGEHLFAYPAVIALHAKGPRALVETPLPIADDKNPTQGAVCLVGTQLGPIEICRQR